LLYRGRGHHRVHSLLRRHVRGTDQLACPLAYCLGYRFHGHACQHAVDFSVAAGQPEARDLTAKPSSLRGSGHDPGRRMAVRRTGGGAE
jgi:hypothetical protein